jgi:hypothetical protein
VHPTVRRGHEGETDRQERNVSALEPFTFGIALIARQSARNWPLIETLLDLTIHSVCAQTDQEFRVVIAGHDRPRTMPADSRFSFLQADWPPDGPGLHNEDSGRKKHAIGRHVLEREGGLLMLLDADDWVDVELVEAARAMIGRHQIGALIETGFVADFRTLRTAAIPHPRIFDREYHRICGSSTIARLRPDTADPLRQNPCDVLISHHEWLEGARANGADLARLPVSGAYVVNTSENHSEVYGPYARWRRSLTECINRDGSEIDDAFAKRFGLSLDRIRAASNRFFPPLNPRR